MSATTDIVVYLLQTSDKVAVIAFEGIDLKIIKNCDLQYSQIGSTEKKIIQHYIPANYTVEVQGLMPDTEYEFSMICDENSSTTKPENALPIQHYSNLLNFTTGKFNYIFVEQYRIACILLLQIFMSFSQGIVV